MNNMCRMLRLAFAAKEFGIRCARSLVITVCFLLAGFPGMVISQETPPANPYLVERGFPPYLAEHRKLFSEKSGIYKAGPYPVWTVHTPGGWIGNVTFIEGDAQWPDRLIGYLDRELPAIYLND